jgi:4a-hydroxytetrahydrobiopterin dehydratase
MSLTDKKCIPCEGGVDPLSSSEATTLLKEIPEWTLSGDAKKISRSFSFKNFAQALAFGNKVGAIAEEEGHHPDLHIEWGRVTVELSTHSIGSLSENDFIVAAKIDSI